MSVVDWAMIAPMSESRGPVIVAFALAATACGGSPYRKIGIVATDEGKVFAADLTGGEQHTHGYVIKCGEAAGCPAFQTGRTYRAHAVGPKIGANLDWIEFRGHHVSVDTTWGGLGPLSCNEAGAHWEEGGSEGLRMECKQGPDPVSWSSDAESDAIGAQYGDTPPCQDVESQTGRSLSVVIKVSPPSGSQWLFDEAPEMVANELLADLNAAGGISFVAASGVVPDLTIDVVLDQETQGTEQDTATADVEGFGSGFQFKETSGDNAFNHAEDAIRGLAMRLMVWFNTGWHSKGTCHRPDGSVRQAS